MSVGDEKSIDSICGPEFCCFLVLCILVCAYFPTYSEMTAPYSPGNRRNIDIWIINYDTSSRLKIIIAVTAIIFLESL